MAFSDQINFGLEGMGSRSFDLYESKAGHGVASAVSETLKMSAGDKALQVQFLGIVPNRLPFLADDSKEAAYGSEKALVYVPRFASMPSTMSRSARAAAVGSSASESAEMAARPSAPAAITSRGVRHGRT